MSWKEVNPVEEKGGSEMISRIEDGFQDEYCQKFGEYRRIKARFVEETVLGDEKWYAWTHFDCPEQNDCQYFNIHRGCPFITKALERFNESR